MLEISNRILVLILKKAVRTNSYQTTNYMYIFLLWNNQEGEIFTEETKLYATLKIYLYFVVKI